MKLFTLSNAKVAKAKKYGYLNAILHLLPSNLSGKNVCPKASPGCKAACLNTAGRGKFTKTQEARKRKTLDFFNDKAAFLEQCKKDIQALKRKAEKENLKPAVRPNGTSDLPTLGISLAKEFPDVIFYDYTKNAKTFDRELPPNYHLTFSRSELNDEECKKLLKKGVNVAVVFDTIPKKFWGYKVINGDETDLRFLDKKGVIVGLSAKGKGKADKTGFVIKCKQHV